MDNFDKNAIQDIITNLKRILGRELTSIETETFSMRRSGIAYEMISDYITDARKSKGEIEEYVINVVNKYRLVDKAK